MQGLLPEIFEMFFKYLAPVNCSLVLSTLYYHSWDQPVSCSINFNYLCTHDLYSPMHNVFWMCAYPLRGEAGGGWALEFESFLGPVKWHWANRLFYAHEPPGEFNGVFIGRSRAHSVGGGGAGE
jgi:hypothetical protein